MALLRQLKIKMVALVKGIRNHWTPAIKYLFLGADEGDCFTFQYIGWDNKLRNYWVKRLSLEHRIGRMEKRYLPTSRIKQKLNRNSGSVDLSIVESEEALNGKEGQRSAYQLPRWMEMILNIDEPFERHRAKNMTRRIRKYALEFEVRTDRKDFDLFYHKMYKPLISKNHGSTAEMASYRLFSNSFLKGDAELLFIVRQNIPIAAQLIERRADTYRILAFGIMDGSPEIQKMGVHGVLYYFGAEYYRKKGQSYLLVGSSSPVALDGVTQFKLRLGARPYMNDLEGRQKYQFIVRNRNSSLFKALRNNPVYYITPSGLSCAVFASGEDLKQKADLLQIIKQVKHENLDKIDLLLQKPLDGIDEWIVDLQSPPVEYSICSYEAN